MRMVATRHTQMGTLLRASCHSREIKEPDEPGPKSMHRMTIDALAALNAT